MHVTLSHTLHDGFGDTINKTDFFGTDTMCPLLGDIRLIESQL